MLSGSIPALVTPFRDEAFDEAAYRDFVGWQISEGSHGLVPCGTTGESATLDAGEHRRVIETCLEAAGGRVPVIAGCGSNDTRHPRADLPPARPGADALCTSALLKPPNQRASTPISPHAEAVDIPILSKTSRAHRTTSRWRRGAARPAAEVIGVK